MRVLQLARPEIDRSLVRAAVVASHHLQARRRRRVSSLLPPGCIALRPHVPHFSLPRLTAARLACRSLSPRCSTESIVAALARQSSTDAALVAVPPMLHWIWVERGEPATEEKG